MGGASEEIDPIAAEPSAAKVRLHRHALEPTGHNVSNRAQFVWDKPEHHLSPERIGSRAL